MLHPKGSIECAENTTEDFCCCKCGDRHICRLVTPKRCAVARATTEIPLHHHPNDGVYRENCKRCRIERAAPKLLNACIAALSQLTEDRKEYLEQDVRQLREAVAEATR